MRLYLTSFRMGNATSELLRMSSGKRALIIANATDYRTAEDRSEGVKLERTNLEELGFECDELDLREYFENSEALDERLKSCDLIWVRGGNTFILNRAMKHSGAGLIIRQLLLEDSVVYGGYSAGIDVLVPDLHGIELVDEPDVVPDGYNKEILWEGLGLLSYYVAPHYRSDHPESDAIDSVVEYFIDNHLPFIALRDGETIVIDGNSQRVLS